MLTIAEWAAKLGISVRRARALLARPGVPGARKFGHVWAIPADAPDPRQPRGRPSRSD